MLDLHVIILAGGRGSRMGAVDKASRLLAGKTLLAHCLDRLTFNSKLPLNIAINANGDPSRFAHHGLPILPDHNTAHEGPLAGILAGMEWAATQGAKRIVTVATDTPFFPSSLPERLVMAQTKHRPSIAASMTATDAVQLQPIFACWPIALRGDLRIYLESGQRKVRHWALQHKVVEVVFPDETRVDQPANQQIDPFFNINTPDDLRRAEQFILGA